MIGCGKILSLGLLLGLGHLLAANPTPGAPSQSASLAPTGSRLNETNQPAGAELPAQQQQQQQQPPRRQAGAPDDEYLIGLGIADITGPAADINLMGYAKPNQDAGGIHLRQFSRSIVIEDSSGKRLLYMSIDNGMVSQLLRQQVLKRLGDHYGKQVYNESNVMMSATHTHSCPGGFFQYLLYNIPSAGFISQTLESLADGMVLSVKRAHETMKRAKIFYSEGELLDASVNRSPTSYENNPSEERARYRHNTDKTMHLLKFIESSSNRPLGMLNWFAVHGTSMNNTNHLISSDNKGYAALLFEQDFNPAGTLPGRGEFVAIFAQANEGDVSPNTRGPRCVDTGLPCDHVTSTCGNPPRNEKCIAFGPGKDMFESTKIIAYKQYFRAKQLFLDEAGQQQLRGPVRFIHEYIDITKQSVPIYKNLIDLARLQKPAPVIAINSTYHTCQAGLGYSFAAGTTDGPGAFDFQQGDTASGRYWNLVRDFLRRPSEEQMKCHHPKPILLSTGEMDFPYMWHPRIVPMQILMVGQLAIVGLPGEFTTMAGRRVREAVLTTLQDGDSFDVDEEDFSQALSPGAHQDIGGVSGSEEPSSDDNDDGGQSNRKKLSTTTTSSSLAPELSRVKRAYSMANEIKVVLSGLSNIYTSYVTTVEEYEMQRYEGASTLYGPHTLQAYINEFKKLAIHLINDEPLGSDSTGSNNLQPPDLSKSLFTFKAGVLYDGAPHGKNFGDLLKDADTNKVFKCKDTISVSFVAGNPRNDLRHEGSFLYVDKYTGNGTWSTIASDSSWSTRFIWDRTNTILGESRAIIQWDIPLECETGVYRIRHFGSSKSLLQTISPYSGQSSPFKVSSDGKDSNLLQAIHQAAVQSILSQKLEQTYHKRQEVGDGTQQTEYKHSSGQQQSGFVTALNRLTSWFTRRSIT